MRVQYQKDLYIVDVVELCFNAISRDFYFYFLLHNYYKLSSEARKEKKYSSVAIIEF